MSRKFGVVVLRQPPFSFVKCPFCGYEGNECGPTNSMPWCGQCCVEWYRDRRDRLVFDDKRKTPRFAWAKAIIKAGGMKVGS